MPPSLCHDLLRRIRAHPDRLAIRWLSDGEPTGRIETRTYAQLGEQIRAVAARLADAGCRGQRVLLLYPPGADFIPAFYACLQVGAVAVPVYPPDPTRLARTLGRLQAIVRSAGAKMVLTTDAVVQMVPLLAAETPDLAALPWIGTDSLDSVAADGCDRLPGADDLAFLQYTSGSTGQPKGVEITHGNLVHNQLQSRQAFDHHEGVALVSWLPLIHDMGVGAFAQPLFCGGTTTLMSPFDFLADPLRWLRTITAFAPWTSGGPNFAYALCARRARDEDVAALDLSHWRVAFCGAEPISADTMTRFADRFAAAGFRKAALFGCYGLAEATLFVSGGPAHTPPSVLSVDSSALERDRVEPKTGDGCTALVGAGVSGAEQTIAIVDPNRSVRVGEAQVGEIWLHGPNIAAGYFADRAASAAAFDGRLDGDARTWLRTGDLGFVHDERLFVTARLKDLIIVRGRNVHAHEVERAVEAADPAVRRGCVAAFGYARTGGEGSAVVAEIAPDRAGVLPDLIERVRDAVTAALGFTLDAVVLIEPRTIPKTTSGKLQRGATRTSWLQGELAVVEAWTAPPRRDVVGAGGASSVSSWLRAQVAAATGRAYADVDPERPFSEQGVDSVLLAQLAGALSEWLGAPVPTTTLFDHPTISGLAASLAGDAPALDLPTAPPAPCGPIAVISMACRFPGGVSSPEALWIQLDAGADLITPMPQERWDTEVLLDDDPSAAGKSYARAGGFLTGVDRFDSALFQITDREAAAMDPQQRLLLEVAWEAFERAGLVPGTGADIGVYIGSMYADYGARQPLTALDGHAGTGSAGSVASGRLAYVLGLSGPAITVDTACSSSLVAIHLACQAIRNGDCTSALAGGVTVMTSPAPFVEFSRLGGLAADGRCKPFSDAADGVAWGEGCAVVLLKPLDAAVRDGDEVVAVIRGSAVNSDGRSNGLTAPSGKAQERVIRQALMQAELTPSQVSYVEAHGTGTKLGDPIEAAALSAVYGAGRRAALPIGSVKSNIGHTQAAAGVAGLIKTVLALGHQRLPATLHGSTPSAHVDWSRGVRLVNESCEWTAGAEPRRAGVSAFGISGTNAHLIIEDAPLTTPLTSTLESSSAGPLPWLVSGGNQAALLANASRLADCLDALPPASAADPGPPPGLKSLAAALALGRVHHRHRAAVIGSERTEVIAALRSLAAGGPSAAVLGVAALGDDGEPVKATDDRSESSLREHAEAHVLGRAVDWAPFFAGVSPRPSQLPTYAFQRRQFALHPSTIGGPASFGLDAADHPLLSAVVSTTEDGQVVLAGRIDRRSVPWLDQHRVHGATVVPGAAMVELALAAAAQVGLTQVDVLDLDAALEVPAGAAVDLRVTVAPAEAGGARALTIDARRDRRWTRHATGRLGSAGDVVADRPDAQSAPEHMSGEALYRRLSGAGLDYGPRFRRVDRVQRSGDRLVAHLSPGRGAAGYRIDPLILDAALHALAAHDDMLAAIPARWRAVSVRATPSSALTATLDVDAARLTAAITVADDRQVVAVVEEIRLAPLRQRAADTEPAPTTDLQAPSFAAPPAPVSAGGRSLVDLERLVTEAVLEVAGEDATEVAVDEPFAEMGLDSLMSTDLANLLTARAGVTVSTADIFRHPQIDKLAGFLAGAGGTDSGVTSEPAPAVVSPVPKEGALSSGQARLWFLDRLIDRPEAYHLHLVVRVHGVLDEGTLRRALEHVVAAHEQLRTCIVDRPDGAKQRVLPWVDVALPVIELASTADDDQIRALGLKQACERFDLQVAPLFRVALVRLGSQGSALIGTWHHAIADAWSLGQFFEALSAAYLTLADGGAPPRIGPPSYFDRSQRQQSALQSAEADAHRRWWREAIAGVPPLAVQTDHPTPARRRHAGGRVSFALSVEVSDAVDALARKTGSTPFVVLLASWVASLGYGSGQDDFLVGTVTAGRDEPGLGAAIGFFVNTLALRCDLRGDPTIEALIKRLGLGVIGALEHSALPFDEIVRAVQPAADSSTSPLFRVGFVLEEGRWFGRELAGLPAEILTDSVSGDVDGTAKFDLTLAIVRVRPDGYRASLEFASDVFERSTVERLADRLSLVIEAASSDADLRLSELPMIADDERQRVLYELNATEAPLPELPSVHQLIEAQVRRTPEAVAVVSGETTLTFAELDVAANRLAHHLRSVGVDDEARVGVALRRSPEEIITFLAVLKAGGAYVPLHPDEPAARLALMAAGAGVAVLVSTSSVSFDVQDALRVDLDRIVDALAASPGSPPPSVAHAEALAYVLFTSGSTGTPKGVEIEHAGVVNLMQALWADFDIGPEDRHLATASSSFDATTLEIWPLLGAGAAVHLADDETRVLPERMLEYIQAYRITTMWLTPRLAEAFCALDLPASLSLRFLFNGGERLQLPRRAPPFTLVHVYGITECTAISTWTTDTCGAPGSVQATVGGPLRNTRIYVLDAAMNPIAPGIAGEVYVGGIGVGRGYAGRPELTAARFLADPFVEGGRLYRSGDIGRWRSDGTLELVGRNDAQIKLRGVRIELGEVEAAVLAEDGVTACVASVLDVGGDRRLVAHVVGVFDPGQLRVAVSQRLPRAMVPGYFVPIEAIPLSSTGKVDRAALPRPSLGGAGGLRAPAAGLESRLATILAELLERDGVGRDESFFDAGAHSLLLAKYHGRIQSELGASLRLVDLFEHPTVAALARHIGRDPEVVEPAHIVVESRPAGEPIAIVGMSGALPGASDLSAHWRNLACGRVSIKHPDRQTLLAAGIPKARLDDPRFVAAHGVLDGYDLFDAQFFDLSAAEARTMDPQQRLLLEHAWHALEDAGLARHRTARTIGVFASGSRRAFPGDLAQHTGDLARLYGERIGADSEFLATRVSWFLGLRGPSMTIQTACSSSLVAVHVACRAIASGECEVALAGGAAVFPPSSWGYLHSEGFIFSSDGQCRAFDAAGDGTVGGSGVAVVALKPLSVALRDGDRIRALILGSATNNDGARKVGYTAPSVAGQVEVLQAAYRHAGVDPRSVGLIEGHGTGTRVGDPIEVEALSRVITAKPASRYDERKTDCAVSTCKASIGHLDAAAGIAGLVSAVLALEAGQRPPTAGFERPNPQLNLRDGALFVSGSLSDWPDGDGPRRAGVSAFGLGGTNAHVVLEQAPTPEIAVVHDQTRPVAICVSGKTEQALWAQASGLAQALEAEEPPALADVAHTLARTRQDFGHRAVVVASEAAQAASALTRIASGRLHDRAAAGIADVQGKLLFVYPGQGGQWPGMGSALLAESEVFRAEIERCDRALRPHTGWSVASVLTGEADAPPLDRVDVVQPALWAMMLGLTEVWRSLGVEPDAVIGHSQGEIAAACAAGILDRSDGARIVATRSRLLRSVEGSGAMALVEMSSTALAPYLEDAPADLTVAAYNGPRATLVAGDAAGVGALVARLDQDGTFARAVAVTYASHSAGVEPIREDLIEAIGDVRHQPGRAVFYSTVTGGVAGGSELDAAYWYRNLREPVRFDAAVLAAAAAGYRAFVEVGAHPVLSIAIEATVEELAEGGEAVVVAPTLRRDEGGLERLLCSAAALHVRGLSVDWTAPLPQVASRVALPGYPFQRQHYPVDHHVLSPVETGERSGHPLLGRATAIGTDGWLYNSRLSSGSPPWLGDHVLFGHYVLPAAAHLEIARAAASLSGAGWSMSEAVLQRPLIVPDAGDIAVQVTVMPAQQGRLRVAVHAEGADGGWVSCSEATFERTGPTATPSPRLPPIERRAERVAGLYRSLATAGFECGPAFRTLVESRRIDEKTRWVRVCLDAAQQSETGAYGLHPALLDGVLQGLALWWNDSGASELAMPFALDRLEVWHAGAVEVWAQLDLNELEEGARADAMLVLADGTPVAQLTGLRLMPVDRGTFDRVEARSAAVPRLPANGRSRYAAMAPEIRGRALLEAVAEEAAAVLGVQVAALPEDRPLKDLGLTSLMALDIRNRLSARTGETLRATLLFDHPTVAAIAAHLGRAFAGAAVEDEPATEGAPSDTSGAAPAPLDVLEDADALDDAALVALADALVGEQ